MSDNIVFRSASGIGGEIVPAPLPPARVVFEDGLELLFENYREQLRRLGERGLAVEERVVAERRLPDPAGAFARMTSLVFTDYIWHLELFGGWVLGVWVGGEVPCRLVYHGMEPVEGMGQEKAGVLEMILLARVRENAQELAAETFNRLYTIMTSQLEIVDEYYGMRKRYIL